MAAKGRVQQPLLVFIGTCSLHFRLPVIARDPHLKHSASSLIASLTILPCVAYAQDTSGGPVITQALSAGFYRAEGDFGLRQDTDITYFPISFEVDNDKWGFQLVASHLELEGPGAVLINVGGINQAVAGSQINRESGIGDTLASVIYHFEPSSQLGPFFDLRLDVKLPTADESKGLGTGETDFNVQLDISQQWRSILLFSSLGYSVRGKSDLYAGLKSGALAQLGFAANLTADLSGGVFYDYRERASDFTPESHELSPYISWRFSDRWTLTTLLTKGFTDASPQWSLYSSLRYSW